jgi:hypothetical protein
LFSIQIGFDTYPRKPTSSPNPIAEAVASAGVAVTPSRVGPDPRASPPPSPPPLPPPSVPSSLPGCSDAGQRTRKWRGGRYLGGSGGGGRRRQEKAGREEEMGRVKVENGFILTWYAYHALYLYLPVSL